MVWSYSAAIMFLGLILMLRPVVAQQKENLPEVKVEVKKEYDEDGNLVKTDSIRTWCWSGRDYSLEEFDSLRKDMGLDFNHMLPGNYNPFSFQGTPPGPPMHNFWHWNGRDSTARSYLEDLFDEETLEQFRRKYHSRDAFRHYPLPELDSLISSFHDRKWFNDAFSQDFRERYDDLHERLENYHREHQKLIEKYFGGPGQGDRNTPEAKQNRHIPDFNDGDKNNSGKI